jgi:hypothetical protein
MSSSTTKENVNIYFKTDDSKEILKASSAYEKYIILMNETLQSEKIELVTNSINLTSKVEEIEEQNDKLDTSCRYLRGLLKNLVELEKMKSEVCFHNKKIINVYEKFYSTNLKTNTKFVRITEAIIVLLFALLHPVLLKHIQYSITLFFILLFNFYLIEFKLIYNFKIPLCNQEKNIIKETELKIKKLKDGVDYLNEYIDSL